MPSLGPAKVNADGGTGDAEGGRGSAGEGSVDGDEEDLLGDVGPCSRSESAGEGGLTTEDMAATTWPASCFVGGGKGATGKSQQNPTNTQPIPNSAWRYQPYPL